MSLDRLFNARSVAVIGASLDETKRGFQAIRTLKNSGYKGEIYPVNPKLDEVLGLTCYPSVADIPGPVDAALITTPARTIPSLLKACGEKGVAGAVVVAAGFGEAGPGGAALEKEMVAAARQAGVRVVGPNTNGLINFRTGLNLVGMGGVPVGDFALLTQSGNMALHLITDAVHRTKEGFCHYVGLGNEAEIKFHEYLDYLAHDPAAKAVVMYAEGFSRGREFLQAAYEASFIKPVVILKSGRSEIGRRSAGSHTGALAGSAAVSAAALKNAGVIALDNPDELFPVAQVLARSPKMAGRRTAVLADGGGHATIAADLLTDAGLELPGLADGTRESLKKLLPGNASTVNPIDVAGGSDADPYVLAQCAELVLADDNVDALIVVGMFGGYHIRFAERLKEIEERTARRLGELAARYGKPIVVHSIFAPHNPEPIQLLRAGGLPVSDSITIACRCLGLLADYSRFRAQPEKPGRFRLSPGQNATPAGRKIIEAAEEQGRIALLETEAKELLALHGGPPANDVLATDPDQAARLAADMTGPLVCKIASPDILHKSEAGGVILNLIGPEEVRAAFETIVARAADYNPEADIRGCLVGPMARPGLELIIGARLDEQFGPVVMCGLGGILVEILKDVSFRPAPLTEADAGAMLAELKAGGRPGRRSGRTGSG